MHCIKSQTGTGFVLIGAALLAGCGASSTGQFTTALSANEPYRISTPAQPAPGASSTIPAAGQASQSSPIATGYEIGPQDVLGITVFKVPELSKSVQVADAGTINLPLVGEVPATGRTAQEIERDLTAKLGAKYLRSPQVTVFVKEYNSQKITVEGAVRKPGLYPIKGQSSLIEAIALAEGLDPSTYDSTVIVFRETNGERMAAKFDIDAIKNGSAEDPAIYKGDVVVVNSALAKKSFDTLLRALPSGGAFANALK